ncbi:transcriptional regulator, PaaX family [Caldalkalibacillus thermarum TA2.A1]|uniref:Transcriptional regulator, PaaX family n=2 Tax=Caldalkalibacillus thermarum (strain TA2.A1) TaxID=986075 RepID=F5L9I0_CALTT|nr:transcriptional regulator, PaaX family [Caldalkalibacillus thermarum TA2.A1]GGK31476.1 phenylacetic acid degradation operon negative regulatory protein PaaX [Caldalkalibacillus thermarum]
MSKGMKTRSMIFTLYGDYIRHYGGEIWIGSLIRLLEAFGHNAQSVRAAMSRMQKQGWVKSHKRGNKSYYSLTERGKKRMNVAAKRIFKLKPERWDGKWRMLIYSIPETKRHIRDELRKELVWSGFGSLSHSCWISPNPLEEQVAEMVERYGLDDYVDFFVAENKGPNDNKSLVERCWDLEEINGRYQEFIDHYSKRFVIDRNKIEMNKMSDEECFVERTKLVHEYRKFLFVDPGLPGELLPDHWLGEHAAALFRDYYQILAKPASRFFEEVFAEGQNGQKEPKYDVLDHPFIIER